MVLSKNSATRALAVFAGLVLLIPTVALVLGASTGDWAKEKLRWSTPCAATGGDADSLFDYMSFYSCCGLLPGPVKFLLLVIWLLLLIALLGSTADMFFVPQLDQLSQDLQLTEDVAGVTLLALGNGMPDVMTATSAINGANDFALTMGEFLGAANFILMPVLGAVLLCQHGPTSVEPGPFLRDTVAYSIVLVFMIVVTWDGTIHLLEALLFFVLYAVYVGVVILKSRRHSKIVPGLVDLELQEGLRAESDRDGLEAHSEDFAKTNGGGVSSNLAPPDATLDENEEITPTTRQIQEDMEFVLLESDMEGEDVFEKNVPADSDPLEGLDASSFEGIFLVQFVVELPFTLARHVTIPAANWNSKRRRLAAMCPTLGLQVALLSFGGWDAFQKAVFGVPLWLLFAIVGVSCSVAVLWFSVSDKRPRWHPAMVLFAFGTAIGWFNLLANECVAVLETFGIQFGISSSVLGITVLSWGNCVGDLVADTSLARQGKSKTAVAGCFGSPLLSDVLGLGVAFTAYVLSNGPLRVQLSLQNKFAAGFLIAGVAITMAVFIVSKFNCPRWFAFVLLGLYSAFMVLSIVAETGVL